MKSEKRRFYFSIIQLLNKNWKLKEKCPFSFFNFEMKLKYTKMPFSIPVLKWKSNGTFGGLSVYCALPSNISKYMNYVNLFYITFTYNKYIRFLLLYYKMTKTGNKFKKAKRNCFVLLYANIPHIYWINTGN